MSSSTSYSDLSDDALKLIHDLCDEFEQACRVGHTTRIEQVISLAPSKIQDSLFRELIDIELSLRREAGDSFDVDEYRERFPNQAELVTVAFQESKSSIDSEEHLSHIGRYSIIHRIGSGGFANVYLAYDDQLDRKVAVKVPHPWRMSQQEDVQRYFEEAQTLARMDHPHIVPVHDIGRTNRFPCFIVSKFIDGTDLVDVIKKGNIAWDKAANWMASIADALHYSHIKGLVHRDVKPGNILLSHDGHVYLADFGVALREDVSLRNEDTGGHRIVGTPAYMSPEQARGEGHRVDGRSDVYSLGAVLYELITGQRTFKERSRVSAMHRIAHDEPKPPRQINDKIPKELERICLRALSKRARERYSTAIDMATELREFLAEYENSLPNASTDTRENSGSSL